jgi:DNA-binding LacI/PurR family transcriptional regulator
LRKKKRYEEISIELAAELRSLPPHSPACSQNGICERFGVSDGTAKKVMSELRSNGIIYSKVGSGSFTTGQEKRSTLLVVSNWVDPPGSLSEICTVFVGSAQIMCSKYYKQYTVQAVDSLDLPEMINEIKSIYQSLRGVIFVRQPELFYKYRKILEVQGVETAFYGSSAFFNSKEKCNFLIYDEYKIAEVAVNELFKAGCRDIGCVYASDYKAFRARYDGYRNALRKLGLRFNRKNVVDCASHKEVENFGSSIFDSKRKAREYLLNVDGIFCYVDRVAFNLLNDALEAGFKVPDDLCVVGVDNHPGGELFKPSLSSVDINLATDAQLMVDLMIKRIEKGKGFQKYTKTPLMRRSSLKNI